VPIALAVDIGGTSAKLALVDTGGAVLATDALPAPRGPSDYRELNQHMRALAEIAGEAPAGVGLSIAGLYDQSRRVLTYQPNNPGLEGVDFVTPLMEGFDGLPCAVERDINAGALGEWRFGVGRGSRRFLCLVLGTGVGAGMIVDGELLRFAFDGIGDPGYVVVAPDGTLCPGGSRGCLEAEVSAPAIAQRALARLSLYRDSSLKQHREELGAGQAKPVLDAAGAGDALALSILEETGALLGIGLSTLASIFAPDTIAIAGGPSESSELYLPAVRQTFTQYTAPFYANDVRILKAALGAQANLVGIAAATFAAVGGW